MPDNLVSANIFSAKDDFINPVDADDFFEVIDRSDIVSARWNLFGRGDQSGYQYFLACFDDERAHTLSLLGVAHNDGSLFLAKVELKPRHFD